MDDAQACRDALAFWQPIIGLSDYVIHLVLDPTIAPAMGMCTPDYVYKEALIQICPTTEVAHDLEATVVHELLHCHFAFAQTKYGTKERVAEEQGVESITRGLIRLRRMGCAPQRIGRIRAVALREGARAREAAHIVGAQTTMPIDPQVLTALALKGGTFMSRDDIPEDCKQYIQEVVAAAAGGGAPAPESTDDPPAAMPPGQGQDQAQQGQQEKPPMRQTVTTPKIDPATDARLRTIETGVQTILTAQAKDKEEQAKARLAADTKTRDTMLAARRADMSDATFAWASQQPLTVVEGFLSTLPAGQEVGSAKRRQTATQGGKGAVIGSAPPVTKEESEIDRRMGINRGAPAAIEFDQGAGRLRISALVPLTSK